MNEIETITNVEKNICYSLKIKSIPSDRFNYSVDKDDHIIRLKIQGINIGSLSFIQEFQFLKILYIRNCQLSSIPESIFHLSELEFLDLSTNNLSHLPEIKFNINSLRILDLSNNKFYEFPNAIFYFRNLKSLNLRLNRIEMIPRKIHYLNELSYLNLSSNNIHGLPDEISELKLLKNLDLTSNKIKELPQSLFQVERKFHWDILSEGIQLGNTFIEEPPIEIKNKGNAAIINYIQGISEEEMKSLNEVKVIFVGDGGAGKTSLIKLLRGEEFDYNESQTQGIDVNNLMITIDKADVKANVWDFGGQIIMQATHQVFLSKRSIYVLLINARECLNEEYWLKQVQSFGGNSPILVAINKIDENPAFQLNKQHLLRKYPSITNFVRISCLEKEGIESFHKELIDSIKKVELLKTNWPLSWFKIKSEIESRNSDYLEYSDYLAICQEMNIQLRSKQNTLVGFLNDLGTVVYFDDIRLNDIQVLNPEWITTGIYNILTSKSVANSNGRVNLKEIPNILGADSKKYPLEKQRYIIELMRKFEICYFIEDDVILIPDLLTVQEPNFTYDFENSHLIIVDYGKFLPHSIMPRLIVNLKNDINTENLWRTGLFVKKQNEYTFVLIADYIDNCIRIYFNGDKCKPFLNLKILNSISTINSSFEQIECNLKLFVSGINQVVDISVLENSHRKKIKTITPEGSSRIYNILKLLSTFKELDYKDSFIVKKQPEFIHYKSEKDIINFKRKLRRIEKKYNNIKPDKKINEGIGLGYKILIGIFTIIAGILATIQLIDRIKTGSKDNKTEVIKEDSLKIKRNIEHNDSTSNKMQ